MGADIKKTEHLSHKYHTFSANNLKIDKKARKTSKSKKKLLAKRATNSTNAPAERTWLEEGRQIGTRLGHDNHRGRPRAARLSRAASA